MPSLAVLYDHQAGQWLRFSHPVEEIEIHHLGEVLPALQKIEQRVDQEGLYAAGFVSYEAASAFDEALQTYPATDFPLLRFGLFASVEQIELPPPIQSSGIHDWQSQETTDSFADKIAVIKDAIARGETYQVNLTFPLSSQFDSDPWTFFLQLVQGQKACGAGFLQSDRWAICSVSPELFFIRKKDQLIMRPMKGTAARGRTTAEDQQQANELEASAKNRAENIMILDMVRNDLGRLARPGEVQAEKICTLEKYPTVWQLTSTATAHTEASLPEIFKALFPCASITGAPKAQTMKIITAIEDEPRNIYTGSFGWVAPNKQAQFNVAIRTALINRKKKCASYGIGAGITWDSECADEYQECLDKAAVLNPSRSELALIETIRWTPGKGYFLLAEHMIRLQDSADYFDFPCSADKIDAYLEALATSFPAEPQRVRLLLHKDGHLKGTASSIPDTPSTSFMKLALAKNPIDSRSILLYHKTTQRQIYETCLAEAGDSDEVILWNERGEVTECCTANLVVERSGQLLTPPLTSGLLPGTYRAYLLKRGILTEQILTIEDLQSSPTIYLINALRKWRKAIF